MNPQDPMLITPNPSQQPTGMGQSFQQPAQPNQSTAPNPATASMFQPIVPAMPQQPDAMAQPQPMNAGPSPVGQQRPFPQEPVPIQPITKLPQPPKKSSMKKPLIIGGALLGILAIVTVLAIVLSGGKGQQAPTQQQADQPQGPQPAQAIDVEQTNNAINQDVTRFDNTKDFPDNMLDDSSLGL